MVGDRTVSDLEGCSGRNDNSRLLRPSDSFDPSSFSFHPVTRPTFGSRWAQWKKKLALPWCIHISPVFTILVVLFILIGVLGAVTSSAAQAICMTLVVVGWLISLALHEYGHAITAYHGGDSSVADKGYLTLDLLRYADPIMTFLVPTALLMLGGVALPGGAVLIMTSSLRSRNWKTFTSLAGPAANFIFGGLISIFLHILLWGWYPAKYTTLAPALTLLVYFQVMAFLLNLLPLPPLDGWGALEPWLPQNCFLVCWMRDPWLSKSVTLVSFLIIYLGVQHIPGFSWTIGQMIKVYGLDVEMLERGQRLFFTAFHPRV